MEIGIIDLCKQIEDPSMNRKKVHKMETSIYIFIAAVICEVQSWNEIEEFGNSKIAFFKSRIPGLEFIPSHDTFNRFFSMIKPDYFELIFRNWVKHNGANSDNESDYKRFQAQVKVDFMFRVAKSFYIGPIAVFDYIDGRDFEKPELWEGMSARTTNTSLGLSLLYDSRDYLTNAYQGYYLRIDQRFSPAFLGNKYAFSSTELTTSYYHPVWKGGVLAGQFHTLLNYGNPPWGLMATLGSSYSMRGYYEGRYRDKCAMDAQIELRQHVWKRNGVAVWAGAGTVFPRFSDFTPKHILPNYGFGYRWEFKKRVNVRLDLGFGKHQTGFIFNINEAF